MAGKTTKPGQQQPAPTQQPRQMTQGDDEAGAETFANIQPDSVEDDAGSNFANIKP